MEIYEFDTTFKEFYIKEFYIHKTKDGTRIPIHRLKKDHLVNIIRMFNRNAPKINMDVSHIIDRYKKELSVRNNFSDQFVLNNESKRFILIKKTRCDSKCSKTECGGLLKQYTAFIGTTRTFCPVCWDEYKVVDPLEQLSPIIQLDELRSSDEYDYWK